MLSWSREGHRRKNSGHVKIVGGRRVTCGKDQSINMSGDAEWVRYDSVEKHFLTSEMKSFSCPFAHGQSHVEGPGYLTLAHLWNTRMHSAREVTRLGCKHPSGCSSGRNPDFPPSHDCPRLVDADRSHCRLSCRGGSRGWHLVICPLQWQTGEDALLAGLPIRLTEEEYLIFPSPSVLIYYYVAYL